jgi:hypothetical protein
MANFFGDEAMDVDAEEDTFRQYNVPTKQSITDEFDAPIESFHWDISERFYITSHGIRLLHRDFPRISIPDNVILYFLSDFGYDCKRYNPIDTTSYACYHPDFIGLFHNADGSWINRCLPGTLINDCLLTPDRNNKFVSLVMVCDKTMGPQIILTLNSGGVLLSDALELIMQYADKNHLQGTIEIFCSFCLDDSYESYSEIEDRLQDLSGVKEFYDVDFHGGKINKKNRKNFKKKSFKKTTNKSKRCRKITRKITIRKK